MDCRHSPLTRGILHHFKSSLVEQAFHNYAAMNDTARREFASHVAEFHEKTNTKNPMTRELL